MDPDIKEIILDKDTKADDLIDILLEFDDETVDPIMDIIENEIGVAIEEKLDIFDWMSDASRNRQLLDSIELQAAWWLIHKKLRRMIRKTDFDERVALLEQEK